MYNTSNDLKFSSTDGVISKFKGYEIQVVDIRPGDTIMIHIHKDMDYESCISIREEMQRLYPDNHILLVNEYVLTGMTILRKAQPINEVVNELELNTPIEKLYPDLFSTSGGNVLW